MADHSDAAVVRGSEILGHSVRPDGEYKVKLYDFKRPDKFSLEQIRTVHIVHETFARLASTVLGAVAGESVNVRCASIDQLAMYEFFGSIPDVSAFIPVSMSPLAGSMLMQVDGSLAEFLVRSTCGDRGYGLREPERPLTAIEQLVMRDVADKLLPVFNEAWSQVVELDARVIQVETDRDLAQIVPPTEMIILASMEVTVGGSTAFINLVIPFITIEPILDRFSIQWWFGRVRPGSATVAGRSAQVPVDVELIAHAGRVPLAELPAILAGEEVELPLLADGRVTLSAGGVAVAQLKVDPSRLTETDSLSLAVAEHLPGILATAGDGSSAGTRLEGMLASSVDALTHHINEVRRSVEQLRDDRESLLADVGDRPAVLDQAGIEEPDRRHHAAIAVLLAEEHPVTNGFILAGLAPETAAAVLADLDPSVQPGTVRAIVELRDADRGLHRILLAYLGRSIARSFETTTSGGVETAVEILNNVPRSTEKNVMETFLSEDKSFFEQLASRMFVFEDFILVDQAAINKVAARVSPEELALALKGVEERVTEHIYAALADDVANAVAAAVDQLGRVRRQDVEAAQRDIIEELRQLEAAGEVVVARTDEVIE